MAKRRGWMLFLVVALVALFGMGVLFASCSCGGDDDDDDDDDDNDDDDDDDDSGDDDTSEQECGEQLANDFMECVQNQELTPKGLALCQIDAWEDYIDCMRDAGMPSDMADCIDACIDNYRSCVSGCGEDDTNCLTNCADAFYSCLEDCSYVPPS